MSSVSGSRRRELRGLTLGPKGFTSSLEQRLVRASLDPNDVYRFEQRRQGVGSSEPARLKDSGNGAPATAVGDGGGEATVEAVGTEVGIQDGGPEEGRTAQDGGGDGVTSIQYRFQVQQAIVNRLYLFSPEDAADVQQLFRQYNRSTLDLAKASVRLLRANQALENLKRRR